MSNFFNSLFLQKIPTDTPHTIAVEIVSKIVAGFSSNPKLKSKVSKTYLRQIIPIKI